MAPSFNPREPTTGTAAAAAGACAGETSPISAACFPPYRHPSIANLDGPFPGSGWALNSRPFHELPFANALRPAARLW